MNTQATEPPDPADIPAIQWAANACGRLSLEVRPLSGDASFRRYLRLSSEAGESWILMISPPELGEKNEQFCQLAELLDSLEVRVPRVQALHRENGWLLLPDFGSEHYLDRVNTAPDQVDSLYRQAIELILKMQLCPAESLSRLECMDVARARREALLALDWYFEDLLSLSPDPALWRRCERSIDWLADAVAAQPRVLVHFDFHSRNLLIPPDGRPAVLDFQDAIAGPVALDPVSLLRDCYYRLAPGQVGELLLCYRNRALELGILPPDTDPDVFNDWFEQCSLQRHLRVLGTFARLWLRDGRDGYLNDLPLTLEYSLEAAGRLPAMEPMRQLLEQSRPVLAQWLQQRSC